jgi:thiopurine S-methyltransferase
MSREFWLRRWAENRIGFHREGVQPLLRRYWNRVAVSGGRVLVPLSGKSHDLAWLAGEGHQIVGVEISPLAAEAFFREQGSEAEAEPAGDGWTRLESGRIRLLVGDFLTLDPALAGRFPLAYDRAALIALPAPVRGTYAAKLKELLEPVSDILLITIEYDVQSMDGPPFPVGEDEVRSLFDGLAVEKLGDRDCLGEEPRFRDRGLTWMREVVYHIRSDFR